jgi:hypothetical protein
MAEVQNRIELEVPPGEVVVRHAECPNGCDLMDPEVEIHGHPSIRVAYEHADRKGEIHLDPIYGSHDNLFDRELPEGTILELSCPSCQVALRDPDATCTKCSAGMFTLHLPKGGFVEACQRKGCFHHKLRIVTGEQMMQRLFDEVGMDAYL